MKSIVCPFLVVVLALAAPLHSAQTSEQKASLDALDGVITRFDALLALDDDVQHKTATAATLDGFKQRRDAIRQTFDQGKYDELRVDLNLEYQRLASWMKPPLNPPTTASLTENLNTRFALESNQLQFMVGEGGLICADVKTSACTGRVYLLGGQVTAWQPAGQEPVIFTSSKSQYAVGKPIRGGVPVCFPWFDGKATSAVAGVGGAAGPQHGIVRTIEWQVEETRALGDGAVSITLITRSDANSRQFWPGEYELREQITFGKQLRMELRVKNTGTELMKYEQDLHTYFYFKDVRKVTVLGLDGVEFIDKYDAGKHKKQQGGIALSATADSIYLGTGGAITAVDESLSRRITIEKINSLNTTVWTPGPTRTVSDLGPDQWMNYACIEVANVGDNAPTVGPGEIKSMGFVVSVGK